MPLTEQSGWKGRREGREETERGGRDKIVKIGRTERGGRGRGRGEIGRIRRGNGEERRAGKGEIRRIGRGERDGGGRIGKSERAGTDVGPALPRQITTSTNTRFEVEIGILTSPTFINHEIE